MVYRCCGAILDKFDLAASATATLPLLCALGALGVTALVRRAELFPYRPVLLGAVFSFAADAFGTFTSSSFSVRAAFHVSRKKIKSSRSTSTSGAS